MIKKVWEGNIRIKESYWYINPNGYSSYIYRCYYYS